MRNTMYDRQMERILALPAGRAGAALRQLIKGLLAEKDYPHAHDASYYLAANLYENDKVNRAKNLLVPIVSNYIKYPFIPKYANMFMLLGIIELNEEDYTLANYYFQSGLKLAKKHKLSRVIFLAYSNLAIVNSALGCHEAALKQLLMSKKYLDSADENGNALVYLNLAVCYKILNRLDESEACLKKCIEQYHGLDGMRRALIQCCQMDLYYKLGDKARYEECERQIISEDSGTPAPDRLQAYQMICENALQADNIALAERMLQRLKSCVSGRNDMATEISIEQYGGRIARMRGDMEQYTASLEKQLVLIKKMNDINSRRMIKSAGIELQLSQLMRKNEDARRNQEQERIHRQQLTEALEMAQAANRAKSDFLARMSHDIRTPMNAIVGYLGIARDTGECPEKVLHCLDNSEIAAKHLLQLINDVLDMSSIESGKMKIASEEFDMKQEIIDATTIFYNTSRAKGVHFDTRIIGVTREWVVGDPLRMNQIVMNLLSNAVKFTPEGGSVRLRIEQLNADDNGSDVKIVVSDTGIGMSQEYMAKMFQPFEQESADTARQYGGSGLGLSIVHRLITMMGGQISVESRQGEGTTFTTIFHFGRAGHEQAAVKLPEGTKPHVMLLTGDEAKGENIKAMFAGIGVSADVINSGRYAVKRLHRRFASDYPYVMCLMDWNNLEGDCAEIAAAIKAEAGQCKFSLVATGCDLTEFEEQARESGVNGFAVSPLFRSDLVALINTAYSDADVSAIHKAAQVNGDLTGRRAILAEDNAMNMEIAVTMLARAGLTIDQAGDGSEALKLYTAAPAGTYDFILMDVQMPVMNGYEATEAIRASGRADAATIPIIAITANAFEEDISTALSHGMTAHIAKPVNYAKLFVALEGIEKKQN